MADNQTRGKSTTRGRKPKNSNPTGTTREPASGPGGGEANNLPTQQAAGKKSKSKTRASSRSKSRPRVPNDPSVKSATIAIGNPTRGRSGTKGTDVPGSQQGGASGQEEMVPLRRSLRSRSRKPPGDNKQTQLKAKETKGTKGKGVPLVSIKQQDNSGSGGNGRRFFNDSEVTQGQVDPNIIDALDNIQKHLDHGSEVDNERAFNPFKEVRIIVNKAFFIKKLLEKYKTQWPDRITRNISFSKVKSSDYGALGITIKASTGNLKNILKIVSKEAYKHKEISSDDVNAKDGTESEEEDTTDAKDVFDLEAEAEDKDGDHDEDEDEVEEAGNVDPEMTDKIEAFAKNFTQSLREFWARKQSGIRQDLFDIFAFTGNQPEATGRLIIDQFILRLIRYLRIHQQTPLLFPEMNIIGGKDAMMINHDNFSTLLTGTVDYAMFSTNQRIEDDMLKKIKSCSSLQALKAQKVDKSDQDSTTLHDLIVNQRMHLFLVEAKKQNMKQKLNAYIPQVMAESIATIEVLDVDSLAWCLTTGSTWIFGVLARGLESRYEGFHTVASDMTPSNLSSMQTIFEAMAVWATTEPSNLTLPF